MAKSKTIEGLESMKRALHCEHRFVFLRASKQGGGVTAKCVAECQCTYTAWPGSIHYDEIVAARDQQEPAE